MLAEFPPAFGINVMTLILSLTYDTSYIFFLSLFNRFKQGGFIDQVGREAEPKKIGNASIFYSVLSHSAIFAYVHTPHSSKQYQPFLSYCIENLLSEVRSDKLVAFINSELQVEQQYDIVLAIALYLKSYEFSSANDKSKQLQRLIHFIPQIVSILYRWEKTLAILPSDGAKLFMEILNHTSNQNLLSIIDNSEQLEQIFKCFHFLTEKEQSKLNSY
ncbi:MAG: hypothetical protein H0W64_02775 [Gammaproteobacteria bacterium]|nr:hypothetical protein [Gammaproteobacteria bacterium]